MDDTSTISGDLTSQLWQIQEVFDRHIHACSVSTVPQDNNSTTQYLRLLSLAVYDALRVAMPPSFAAYIMPSYQRSLNRGSESLRVMGQDPTFHVDGGWGYGPHNNDSTPCWGHAASRWFDAALAFPANADRSVLCPGATHQWLVEGDWTLRYPDGPGRHSTMPSIHSGYGVDRLPTERDRRLSVLSIGIPSGLPELPKAPVRGHLRIPLAPIGQLPVSTGLGGKGQWSDQIASVLNGRQQHSIGNRTAQPPQWPYVHYTASLDISSAGAAHPQGEVQNLLQGLYDIWLRACFRPVDLAPGGCAVASVQAFCSELRNNDARFNSQWLANRLEQCLADDQLIAKSPPVDLSWWYSIILPEFASPTGAEAKALELGSIMLLTNCEIPDYVIPSIISGATRFLLLLRAMDYRTSGTDDLLGVFGHETVKLVTALQPKQRRWAVPLGGVFDIQCTAPSRSDGLLGTIVCNDQLDWLKEWYVVPSAELVDDVVEYLILWMSSTSIRGIPELERPDAHAPFRADGLPCMQDLILSAWRRAISYDRCTHFLSRSLNPAPSTPLVQFYHELKHDIMQFASLWPIPEISGQDAMWHLDSDTNEAHAPLVRALCSLFVNRLKHGDRFGKTSVVVQKEPVGLNDTNWVIRITNQRAEVSPPDNGVSSQSAKSQGVAFKTRDVVAMCLSRWKHRLALPAPGAAQAHTILSIQLRRGPDEQ